MNIEALFQHLKQVTGDLVRGETTRTLAAHMLVEALFRVDGAAKAGEITKNDKNRLVVLVLQHLSLILRSPGPGGLLNRLRRGNLLLNSRPMLLITGFDFSGLTLPEFNITATLFIACDFNKADLRRAKITGCQLQYCTFRNADLSGADFRGSALYGCAFEDASTRGAAGLG